MIGKSFNARQYSMKPRAALQLTGKLGFNTDAIAQMGITPDSGIVLAPEMNDKEIYYAKVVTPCTEDAFPVKRSGDYFYINTKLLFDERDLDYTHITYIFDIARCEKYDNEIDGVCYKLKGRHKPRTQAADQDELEEQAE